MTQSEIQEHKVARSEFVTRLFIITVLAIGIATLVGLTILGVLAYEQAKSNGRTADTIEDCTNPRGECYQRGQERTAKAVGDINRVIVLAAACSVGLDEHLTTRQREVRIQTCVISRLASGTGD